MDERLCHMLAVTSSLSTMERLGSSGATTVFSHADHLGIGSGGEYRIYWRLPTRIDYLPFGEQITGGSGNHPQIHRQRTCDTESGLDNSAKARYNSSSLKASSRVRDPILIMPQKLIDPQQWNLYSYVRNNPLNLTDPTGMYTVSCKDGDKKCNKSADNFEKQRQKDLKSKSIKVRNAAKAWGDPGGKRNPHPSVTFKTQQQVDADAHTLPGYKTDGFVTAGATADHQPDIKAEFMEKT